MGQIWYCPKCKRALKAPGYCTVCHQKEVNNTRHEKWRRKKKAS